MKTIIIKGICVNIDKTRNIRKLTSLKEICQDELGNKQNYKGHHKLLHMYVDLITLRIAYMQDIDYALEVDNYILN